MNAEHLLKYYERIADAPDAVPRLRRFILDLAVRGKLVPQDPNDEPASELLRRIEREKARLVEAREVRDRKNGGRERDERPEFDSPPGWKLAALGDVALKITDGAHKTPTYVEKGVPFVSVKDFSGGRLDLSNTRLIPEREHEALYKRCDPRRGDILIGRIGTLGKAVLVDTDVEFSLFVSVGLIRFDHTTVNQRYFQLVLNSPFVEFEFDRIKIGGGTHTNKLNLGDLHTIAFPLPPLAEQHRIVAKVDELMALVDRLEAARTRREATRDKLVAASLARLNAPDPETFHDDARFALDTLPALTARPDQIKQLRQTILNLAMRGKLVPQDPNDEPAAELLTRIGGGWLQEVRDDSEGDPSYTPPVGWEMARVEHCFVVSGGIQKTPARAPKEHAFPYLGVGNVYRGRLELSNVKQFELAAGELDRYALKPGDILVVEGNGSPSEIGRCAVWNGEIDNCVHQNHLIRCRPLLSILTPFTTLLLNSPDGMAEMKRLAITSAGLYSLSVGKIRRMSLAIPPLAEQQRIVAKVDELMALCDRLEASLTTGDDTRRRLLNALLAEALAPAAAAHTTETAAALATLDA